MATIAVDNDVVTLVNVFTVEPANQQALIDLLEEATKTVMDRMPGFVSANLHRSLDGVRVTNYAQWRRASDYEAMLSSPEAQVHMRAAAKLATSFEPHLYSVAFTDPAGK